VGVNPFFSKQAIIFLRVATLPPETGLLIDYRSYITGVFDALSMFKYACPPVGVSGTQAVDVVMNRLRAHPEVRHYAASGEVAVALKQAFPCQDEGRTDILD
jgi:hypothetical protein